MVGAPRSRLCYTLNVQNSLPARSIFLSLVVVVSNACSSFGGSGDTTASPDAGVEADGGITGEPGDDSILLHPVGATATIMQGNSATVTVSIERGKDQYLPVTVKVTGLPDGVTAPVLSIAGLSGDLVISASPAAVQGTGTVTIEASVGTQTLTTPLKILVRGVPGAVDTTWGSAGTVRSLSGVGQHSGLYSQIGDCVLAPDDSIYCVGGGLDASSLEFSRGVHILASGTIDSAFAGGGTAELTAKSPHAIAVQSDGKVIVTGGYDDSGSNGKFYLRRFTTAGALDPDFVGMDSGGPAVGGALSGNSGGVYGVALRKDGDIFVAWDNNDAGTPRNAVARFLSTGNAPAGYGLGGAGATRSGVGFPIGIAVRSGGPSDGNTVSMFVDQDGHVLAIQLLGTTGAVDSAFNGGTAVSISLPGVQRPKTGAQGMVQLADGSLLAPFRAPDGIYLVKLGPTGAAPPGFGTAGLAGPFDVPGDTTGIAVQGDGKVLVALDTGGLLRFTAGGVIDTTFGNQGVVTTPLDPSHASRKVVIQKSGRILVSGVIAVGGVPTDGAVTAYWP